MSLSKVILGYLSIEQSSGYDLKKRIGGSSLLPWSANNNQIYRTLLDLEAQGLTEGREVPSPEGPVRKVYGITASGMQELDVWLRECPEPGDVDNPLVLKLVVAQGRPEILRPMVREYEERLYGLLTLARARREDPALFDWKGLAGGLAMDLRESLLEAEHAWVRRVRHALEKEASQS